MERCCRRRRPVPPCRSKFLAPPNLPERLPNASQGLTTAATAHRCGRGRRGMCGKITPVEPLTIAEAADMWDVEPGYLNSSSYGPPPLPAFEALTAALEEW